MCVPGAAKTPFMPVRALGAPHTTWIGPPVPVLTMQTRSRSAFGMLPRLDDIGDDEGLQPLRRVRQLLELQAEMRQRLGDLVRRGVGVEVVFQPGESEFHPRVLSEFGGWALADKNCGVKTSSVVAGSRREFSYAA